MLITITGKQKLEAGMSSHLEPLNGSVGMPTLQVAVTSRLQTLNPNTKANTSSLLSNAAPAAAKSPSKAARWSLVHL